MLNSKYNCKASKTYISPSDSKILLLVLNHLSHEIHPDKNFNKHITFSRSSGEIKHFLSLDKVRFKYTKQQEY